MNIILLLSSSSILALGTSLLADRGKNKLNRWLKIIMLCLFIISFQCLLAFGIGYITGYLSR